MAEFFQNLQWYEWVFGIIATGVLGLFGGYMLMGLMVMFVWHFLTNEKVQTVTLAVVLIGSGAYIFRLIAKYT